MKIKDERIEQGKNKIYGELFQLVYLLIAVSFVIKSLYFKMDLWQCSTEYLILICTPVYMVARSRQLNVVLNVSPKSQQTKKVSIIFVLSALLVFGFLFLSKDTMPSGYTIGLVVAYIVIAILIFIFYSRTEVRRMKKLESDYDDRE